MAFTPPYALSAAQPSRLGRIVVKPPLYSVRPVAPCVLVHEDGVAEDYWCTSPEELDAFKAEPGRDVKPQVFVTGKRFEADADMRRLFSFPVKASNAVTCRAIGISFAMTALVLLAANGFVSLAERGMTRAMDLWTLVQAVRG